MIEEMQPEVSPEQDRRLDQETRNSIAFGFDVQNWITSPIGRYVIDKSHKQCEGFRTELETVDPTDADEIRKIQLEIAARRIWQAWLYEAIAEGEAAQKQFIEAGE
jgi:hypothetical protein